jgi:hypothetical protein
MEISPMPFTPRVDSRPGSKGDASRCPRWFKSPALGVIEERDANRLWFQPNRNHPALRDLPDVHLGIEGEPATMQATERAFRDANLVRREFRQKRKAERAERVVNRGLAVAA